MRVTCMWAFRGFVYCFSLSVSFTFLILSRHKPDSSVCWRFLFVCLTLVSFLTLEIDEEKTLESKNPWRLIWLFSHEEHVQMPASHLPVFTIASYAFIGVYSCGNTGLALLVLIWGTPLWSPRCVLQVSEASTPDLASGAPSFLKDVGLSTCAHRLLPHLQLGFELMFSAVVWRPECIFWPLNSGCKHLSSLFLCRKFRSPRV